MINILVALRVWKNSWKSRHIKFFVDNEAVVKIMSSGYTKDSYLAAIARNIWLVCSVYDITISVFHIAGYKNVTADLLSRWQNSENDVEKLNHLVSQPSWCQVIDEDFVLNMEI